MPNFFTLNIQTIFVLVISRDRKDLVNNQKIIKKGKWRSSYKTHNFLKIKAVKLSDHKPPVYFSPKKFI